MDRGGVWWRVDEVYLGGGGDGGDVLGWYGLYGEVSGEEVEDEWGGEDGGGDKVGEVSEWV